MSAEGYREKKGIPAGRPGKDEDIAQTVLMLAVNTYINGQVCAFHHTGEYNVDVDIICRTFMSTADTYLSILKFHLSGSN